MSSVAIPKKRQIPWARRALGVFVVVWLNLALQPCAMAMGVDGDHDCPHYPPSHTQRHEGHEMSSDTTADHDMPCATGVADCTTFDAVNVAARSWSLKLKDTSNDQPDVIGPFAAFIADTGPNRTVVVEPPRLHPPDFSPPLNVLYCVYLI